MAQIKFLQPPAHTVNQNLLLHYLCAYTANTHSSKSTVPEPSANEDKVYVWIMSESWKCEINKPVSISAIIPSKSESDNWLSNSCKISFKHEVGINPLPSLSYNLKASFNSFATIKECEKGLKGHSYNKWS